ncbi:MAG: hypothetical protein U0361_17220 [Nitrospiraceae bacterium]
MNEQAMVDFRLRVRTSIGPFLRGCQLYGEMGTDKWSELPIPSRTATAFWEVHPQVFSGDSMDLRQYAVPIWGGDGIPSCGRFGTTTSAAGMRYRGFALGHHMEARRS